MYKQLYLLAFIFLLGCKSNSKNNNLSFKEAITCFDIDNEEFCIPQKWNMEHQTKYFFYSSIKPSDENEYFVILKYNKLTSGLNIHDYLKNYYSVLLKSTTEKFTGYTCKRFISSGKTGFFSMFYTIINNKPYITVSTIFENDKDLYEFALKSDSATSIKNQFTFKSIILSYKHNNKIVFPESADVNNVQIIDLSKF